MQNNNQVPATTVPNAVRDSSIGRVLLQLGKISLEDSERILAAQQKNGLRFGDAAIKLGLIKEADIRQVLAMQFNYPYLQAGQGDFSAELVAAYQPFTPQVEALRALRSNLMMSWFNEGYKSLAVVSSHAGEGSSFLAANLAIVFSQLGEKTLLVDANLREPRQHSIFNLKQNLGLSDIIAGRAGMDIITKVDSFVDFSVLGAGTIPPNPQELLNRSTFTDFMNQAIAQYDVVLVDTTPTSATADAQATAARCGGALLVSRLNHTRLSDLTEMREQISVTGARIVAAVVNDF